MGSPQKGWGSVCALAMHGQGRGQEGPGGAFCAGGVAHVLAAQVHILRDSPNTRGEECQVLVQWGELLLWGMDTKLYLIQVVAQ